MTTTIDATAGVTELGYRVFDADTHFYEPVDAFTRHADPTLAHKGPRWVELPEDGSRRLVIGDRMNRYLGADQTFSHVGRAGGYAQGEAFVANQKRENLEPIRPEYRERSARLEVMDRQGMEATMLFPTLAVSVEAMVADDVELTYGCLHAFNQWLDEDWGFNYQNRIVAPALCSLLDPVRAVDELAFAISRGARVVHLRPGPAGGHSPADPRFDPFWRAAADADIAVVFHACDDAYRHAVAEMWGLGNINIPARHTPPLQRILSSFGRPIHDTVASLVYGKLFERFPTLRVGTIELGSFWVPTLLDNFARAGQGDLAQDPVATFRAHVWVAPFESEDLRGLAEMIGTERIVFGSDYPHTDGLAEPATFVDYLEGFDEAAVRRIMRDNVAELLGM